MLCWGIAFTILSLSSFTSPNQRATEIPIFLFHLELIHGLRFEIEIWSWVTLACTQDSSQQVSHSSYLPQSLFMAVIESLFSQSYSWHNLSRNNTKGKIYKQGALKWRTECFVAMLKDRICRRMEDRLNTKATVPGTYVSSDPSCLLLYSKTLFLAKWPPWLSFIERLR